MGASVVKTATKRDAVFERLSCEITDEFQADNEFSFDYRSQSRKFQGQARSGQKLWTHMKGHALHIGKIHNFHAEKADPVINYGWRSLTRSLETAPFSNGHSHTMGATYKELEQGMEALLQDEQFRGLPQKGEMLWACFLDKIRHVNKLGGPPVRVVWWKTLDKLGRIPRFPDDREHILDLEQLVERWLAQCVPDGPTRGCFDGHYLSVRFISHRWAQPHYCEECSLGTCDVHANPDTWDNIKAQVLGQWGRDLYYSEDIRPFRPEDLYFWIDYAGIHQEDPYLKLSGITLLPLYISCCANGMVCYVDEDLEYADRAWTALERILGYCLTASPALMKIDRGYLSNKPLLCNMQLTTQQPGWWSMHGHSLWLRLHDPTKGNITVPGDADVINRILDLAMHAHPVDYFQVKSPLKLGVTDFRVDDVAIGVHIKINLTRRKFKNNEVRYTNETVGATRRFKGAKDLDEGGNASCFSCLSRPAKIEKASAFTAASIAAIEARDKE